MKKLVLTLLMTMTSLTALGADQISVTINGQQYTCSGSGAAAEPQVVRVFCECNDSGGIYFRRIAVMSNGSSKVATSTQLTPSNGSYNPQEVMKKCEAMVKQCN